MLALWKKFKKRKKSITPTPNPMVLAAQRDRADEQLAHIENVFDNMFFGQDNPVTHEVGTPRLRTISRF